MEFDHYETRDNAAREGVLNLMRLCNEETTPSLADMAREWLVEDGNQLDEEEALRVHYEDLTDEVLVAREDGHVIGFCLLKDADPFFEERAPDHWPCTAATLGVVHPDHRRRGVADRLLERAEEIARHRDRPYFAFATASTNPGTQGIAEANGYEEVSRVSDDRGPGVDTLVYARSIDDR